MKLTEQTFQQVIKAGAIGLAAAIVLNIFLVLRNRELFRDASRAEVQAVQMGQALQLMQGALQEYAARAASDPQLAGLLRRLQTMPAAEAPPAGAR